MDVKNIINTALYVLGALAVIMIIYGGITYVISAGDAKKVEQAKNIIIYQSITIISSAGILSSDHKMVFCTKI